MLISEIRKKPEIKVLSLILIGSFFLMVVLSPRNFLQLSTFQGMAFQLPELGLLSLAMMVSMLTGGINLSIIATANISAITAAMIITSNINPEIASAGDGLVILGAILAALLVSLLVGCFNGLLISMLDIPPILATLGTMKLLQGLAFIITRGYVISGMPEAVRIIGNGLVLGIPVPLLIFAFFAWLMAFYLKNTSTGFNTFLYGSNPVATFFSGVSNKKVILNTYIISGFYCGLAALVMMSRFNSAKAGYGESYLLVTILAAVLGGVKSEGGFGDVTGLVLALVILQIISNGLNLLGVSSFLTVAIWGLIMITVMIIHYFSGRNRAERAAAEEK